MARGHGRGAGAAAKRALGVGRVRGAGVERLRRERTCVVNVAPVSAMKRSPTCAALLPYFLPISAQAFLFSPPSAPKFKKMTPDPPYLIFNWLVLLCIDSYDSEQRRILQHFSRSTRFAFFSRP